MSSYFDENTPDIVIRSLFQKYDRDSSGQLSVKEIPELLTNDLGLSTEEAETYTLLLDKDASGSLSFDEFKSWLTSGEKLKTVDSDRFNLLYKAVEMFKRIDADQSGSIDRTEFAKLHAEMGGRPEYLDYALSTLDSDYNGKISFLEFMKWLNWIDMSNFS